MSKEKLSLDFIVQVMYSFAANGMYNEHFGSLTAPQRDVLKRNGFRVRESKNGGYNVLWV